jgi:RNA polymerase sigma factor (sigma-70 family)
MPTTSSTLLSRVGEGDEAAWREFDANYGNLIVRYCCRVGLRYPDAEDIRQIVMAKLAQALRSFAYERTRGHFRGYLGKVVRNEIARHHARPDPPRSRVDDCVSLQDLPGAEWDEEWIQHHLRMAMTRVRQLHDPRSVEVFERLLAGDTVAEVAASFDLTVDAVHKVKQRIRDRLKEIVAVQVREEDDSHA